MSRPKRSVKPNNLKETSFSEEEMEMDEAVSTPGCLSLMNSDSENPILNNDKIPYSIPSTSQNAPKGSTLDLCKQYKRRADFCDRELIRIHDKSKNRKDGGSEDRGLVYIDFNAGIFETLKINLLKCLDIEYNTILTSDPKLEFYGEALDRICLDLQMRVGDKIHNVKLKVYNTKCSMDVARQRGTLKERFDHLHNLTVGDYFASHIISKIVEKIDKSFDISKLNMYLKKLANEGKKSAKTKVANKKCCKECKKDVKSSKTISCITCKESTHFSCLSNEISEERKEVLSKNNEFLCGPCRVYPKIIDVDDDGTTNAIEMIDNIKMNLFFPETQPQLVDLTSTEESPNEKEPDCFKCQHCDFTNREKRCIDEHISQIHEFLCTECDRSFTEKNGLEQHILEEHDKRGTKRHRLDTSLLFDPSTCLNCEQSKKFCSRFGK